MTSHPAATPSWIALQPTLEAPDQMRRVFPSGLGSTDGCGSARKSFWNIPQAEVERPSGRTLASSKDMLSGMGENKLSVRRVYS